MLRKDLKVVVLAKKRSKVGGQCVHKLLPLVTVSGLQPAQVRLKTLMSGLTQAA
jgi:hypothetical protein